LHHISYTKVYSFTNTLTRFGAHQRILREYCHHS